MDNKVKAYWHSNSWATKTCLIHTVNIMAANGLVPPGTRASAAMILTQSDRNNSGNVCKYMTIYLSFSADWLDIIRFYMAKKDKTLQIYYETYYRHSISADPASNFLFKEIYDSYIQLYGFHSKDLMVKRCSQTLNLGILWWQWWIKILDIDEVHNDSMNDAYWY